MHLKSSLCFVFALDYLIILEGGSFGEECERAAEAWAAVKIQEKREHIDTWRPGRRIEEGGEWRRIRIRI